MFSESIEMPVLDFSGKTEFWEQETENEMQDEIDRDLR